MAEFSKIAWTTHTMNPWRGCQKVAAGCTNCYAETLSKRNPGVLGIWGPNGSRVIASEDMWKKPLKWNREAQCNCGAAGMGDRQCKWCEGGCERPRVFCASIADVFEDWDGQVVNSRGDKLTNWLGDGRARTAMTLDDVRARLFNLIDATPNIDWLLLTKRPENIRKMWVDPIPIGNLDPRNSAPYGSALRKYRSNAWIGCSIAEQADAERNIPLLLKCRDLTPVLFVSAEPLIGPVDFTLSGATIEGWDEDWKYNVLSGHEFSSPRDDSDPKSDKVDWLITGGESGHHARQCNVDWIRSIVRQCQGADCPVFVKQLGSNCIAEFDDNHGTVTGRIHCSDPKGGDPDEWPEDLRVREFPKLSKESSNA